MVEIINKIRNSILPSFSKVGALSSSDTALGDHDYPSGHLKEVIEMTGYPVTTRQLQEFISQNDQVTSQYGSGDESKPRIGKDIVYAINLLESMKTKIGDFEYTTGMLEQAIEDNGGAEGLFSRDELLDFIERADMAQMAIPGVPDQTIRDKNPEQIEADKQSCLGRIEAASLRDDSDKARWVLHSLGNSALNEPDGCDAI